MRKSARDAAQRAFMAGTTIAATSAFGRVGVSGRRLAACRTC
jgi:hypothetical protein